MSDLISRSALKKYMRDYKWEFALNSDFSKAIEMVDVQPTIEAVPVVHGEWENVGDNEEDLCFRCTNCNTEFSCEINMRQFAKHCPNCGADMRKGGAE